MPETAASPSALRARAIYDRLMDMRPTDMSNNEWTRQAGVNMSFFTNLRKGSEPSVGNLRSVLQAIGVSLPEFFVAEAQGRLIPMPSQQQLEAAILAVLPGLPRTPDRRAEYLAEAVRGVLALQADHLSNIVEVNFRTPAEKPAAGESHATTKSAGPSLPRTG